MPQDANPAFAGERKAVYAVDETGRYTTAASTGWTVEAVVTGQAVEEYARQAQHAWARARAGAASPLEFHMYDRRMDIADLAQATGLWQWRVRRHLKPAVFAQLSGAVLARYAEALGLEPAALRRLPERAP